MSKKIYKIGKVCNFKELTNFVGNKKINAISISLFKIVISFCNVGIIIESVVILFLLF